MKVTAIMNVHLLWTATMRHSNYALFQRHFFLRCSEQPQLCYSQYIHAVNFSEMLQRALCVSLSSSSKSFAILHTRGHVENRCGSKQGPKLPFAPTLAKTTTTIRLEWKESAYPVQYIWLSKSSCLYRILWSKTFQMQSGDNRGNRGKVRRVISACNCMESHQPPFLESL